MKGISHDDLVNDTHILVGLKTVFLVFIMRNLSDTNHLLRTLKSVDLPHQIVGQIVIDK